VGFWWIADIDILSAHNLARIYVGQCRYSDESLPSIVTVPIHHTVFDEITAVSVSPKHNLRI
jgi:hypothetical protein